MNKILFDAHTHLNFEGFSDEERSALAEEIENSAVKYIIDAGDSLLSSEQALRDAEAYEWCYAAVGLHPSQAGKAGVGEVERIRELALSGGKVAAIGEIGLDFYYGRETKEEQVELFRRQIRLANELKLPIMVHTRDADRLTMDILTEEGAFSDERKEMFPRRPDGKGNLVPDARVQLHCYSGSAELAEEYVRLGATFSLGGPVTFKNGRRAVEVVQRIPLEYLMSETDAPYLSPEPKRGRQNRSPYIEHIVRRMAVLKGLEYEETAAVLTKNGERFFNIGLR